MVHEILPVGALQCNCSILGDEASGEAIVVDPGDEVPRILAVLARHKLTVKQILITHAHIDHIAGAARLQALTGAPILYNQNDLPLVKMMAVQAGWLGVETPEVRPPDDTLDDGKLISIGAVNNGRQPSPAASCTPPATPRAASASTSRRRTCCSPATPSSPAPSAAPTFPAATAQPSSAPSTASCSRSPTPPSSSPAMGQKPPSATNESPIHS